MDSHSEPQTTTRTKPRDGSPAVTTHVADPHIPPARGASRARISTRTWARVQAASGLVFAAFGTLHLINLATAMLGPAAYNGMQRFMRPVQHFPPVEVLLIIVPVLVHVVAAVMRIRARPSRGAPQKNRTLRWHRYAGYFLALFIAGHIGATRLPAIIYGIYPEFEGVAFTFQFIPQYFYPYYTLLTLAGLVHLAVGLPLALRTLGMRAPSPLRIGRRFWLPVGATALILLGGLAGLSGHLFPVADLGDIPYAQLVQRFWPGQFE